MTGLFDSHMHIIDPRFPMEPNNGYLPPDFTVEDYRVRVDGLGITAGAVVSGSFQGFDQGYLRSALAALGPQFVGVTQLPNDVDDAEILALTECGVRAVRFNVMRGGSATLEHLDALARRVHDVAGWHAELYVDARDLAELTGTLSGLPAVSIDHLGLNAEGLPSLLQLVDSGARVKATGFGRYAGDVRAALRAIADVDPTALMFGTDLPSTRAPRPFEDTDITFLREAIGDERTELALAANALSFYGMR